MARVTVEDCMSKVVNKFELVVLAAMRAKDIHSGGSCTINRDSDKDSVIALREIALGNVNIESLRKSLLDRLHSSPIDDVEDENLHVDSEISDEFDYISQDVDLDEDLSLSNFEDVDLDNEEKGF